MNIKKFEALFNKNTKSWLVYLVLKDKKWHCRSCEYQHVESGQIAGGAGIQGIAKRFCWKTRNGHRKQKFFLPKLSAKNKAG